MENTKFTQIIEVVEALHEEMKPTYIELVKLRKALSQLASEENDKTKPLSELIVRITKTARRHDLTNKVNIKNGRGKNEVVVGTNHQGLGYQESYSSQLSPLVPESSYTQGEYDEQTIRDIMFDENAVIELTSIIKKSNQKTFLKTLQILKKYKLVEAFNVFKMNNIEKIEVGIDDTKYKIVLDVSRHYEIDFQITKDGEKIASIEFDTDDKGKVQTKFNHKEDDEIFKEISPNRYGDTSLNQIKTLFLISKYNDDIIKAVQEKTKLLNGVITNYKGENKELNEILQPLLALEKL